MKNKLSACALRRQTFILAILKGRSAADAARDAGYKGKDSNMRIRAWEMLQRPDIKEQIRALMQEAETKAIATTQQILKRLSEIIFDSNPGDSIKAAHEINLMRRVYREGVDVNVQQRQLNISVVSESAREKVLKILDGYRTMLSVPESGVIEGDDTGSREGDLSEESINKNSEVNDERRGLSGEREAQIG